MVTFTLVPHVEVQAYESLSSRYSSRSEIPPSYIQQTCCRYSLACLRKVKSAVMTVVAAGP